MNEYLMPDDPSKDKGTLSPQECDSESINKLTFIRSISILSVLVIHAVEMPLRVRYVHSLGNDIYDLILLASLFAVPAMVFVSGYSLTRFKHREDSYLQFLGRRFRRLFMPYAAWTAIYSCIRFDTAGLHWATPPLVVLVRNLLTGGAQYHLYFLPRILILYAAFPLLEVACRSVKLLAFWLLTALALAWAGFMLPQVSTFPGLSVLAGSLSWAYYFILGIWFASTSARLECSRRKLSGRIGLFGGVFIPLLILAVMVLTHRRQNNWIGVSAMKIGDLVYAPLVVLLVWSRRMVKLPLANLLERIASRSFGIYLSHVLVLDLLILLARRLGMVGFPVAYLPVVMLVMAVVGVFGAEALAAMARWIRRGMLRLAHSGDPGSA